MMVACCIRFPAYCSCGRPGGKDLLKLPVLRSEFKKTNYESRDSTNQSQQKSKMKQRNCRKGSNWVKVTSMLSYDR